MEIRLLHKTKTMLVKLAPGARVPEHHHDSGEQCLVLEGRLTDGQVTGGFRLHAGWEYARRTLE